MRYNSCLSREFFEKREDVLATGLLLIISFDIILGAFVREDDGAQRQEQHRNYSGYRQNPPPSSDHPQKQENTRLLNGFSELCPTPFLI
jgi:hypothetical protein